MLGQHGRRQGGHDGKENCGRRGCRVRWSQNKTTAGADGVERPGANPRRAINKGMCTCLPCMAACCLDGLITAALQADLATKEPSHAHKTGQRPSRFAQRCAQPRHPDGCCCMPAGICMLVRGRVSPGRMTVGGTAQVKGHSRGWGSV